MEVGKVYTFKLNSGEEFIAKVAKNDGGFIQIEEPASIAPGQKGMQLVPTLFTAETKQNFTLNMNCVAMFAETEDGVCMKYIEATTGIQVPEKKILVG